MLRWHSWRPGRKRLRPPSEAAHIRLSRRGTPTPGVTALGAEAVARIVKTIEVFDDFCANDPHEEHDFGAFDVDVHTIMFKIDYYDQKLSMHSPDPPDPAITQRVITIMLAEEY